MDGRPFCNKPFLYWWSQQQEWEIGWTQLFTPQELGLAQNGPQNGLHESVKVIFMRVIENLMESVSPNSSLVHTLHNCGHFHLCWTWVKFCWKWFIKGHAICMPTAKHCLLQLKKSHIQEVIGALNRCCCRLTNIWLSKQNPKYSFLNYHATQHEWNKTCILLEGGTWHTLLFPIDAVDIQGEGQREPEPWLDEMIRERALSGRRHDRYIYV